MASLRRGGVRDVPAETFIKAYSEQLKKNDQFELPVWVDLVKTAKHKELAPYDPDWYYVRSASLLRKIYMKQGIGVGAFTRQYGGRNKRKGAVPEHFSRASAGLIRHILIQLESLGLVEKHDGRKGGRKITAQGQRDLDTVANSVVTRTVDAAEEVEEEDEE